MAPWWESVSSRRHKRESARRTTRTRRSPGATAFQKVRAGSWDWSRRQAAAGVCWLGEWCPCRCLLHTECPPLPAGATWGRLACKAREAGRSPRRCATLGSLPSQNEEPPPDDPSPDKVIHTLSVPAIGLSFPLIVIVMLLAEPVTAGAFQCRPLGIISEMLVMPAELSKLLY